MNRYKYNQREATRGAEIYHQMAGRRLAADWRDQGARLEEELAGDAPERGAEWVLNGSYGSEFFELLKFRMQDLPTTPVRRSQAIRRIAIEAFVMAALMDYSDLNLRKITQIVKASGRMDEINKSIMAYVEEMIEDESA